jgi:hypothetical protein
MTDFNGSNGDTDTVHVLSIHDLGDRWRRACTCGFQTYAWEKHHHRMPEQVDPNDCPKDPTVRSLRTLQFSWGGLFDGRPADDYAVHLVRATNRGTPGPSLCGIDRFDKNGPGWSVGGGLSGPGIVHRPCDGCVDVAVKEFPGLSASGGVGGKEIQAALDAAQAQAVAR